MAKLATFFILTLLFISTISLAARSGPTLPNQSAANTQVEAGTSNTVETEQFTEESCDGLGEEECLMRRTLAAHVDYIYTQKHKP